eukprot:2919586-Amphidinium_carterae.1
MKDFTISEMKVKASMHLRGSALKAVMETQMWAETITSKYISHYDALYEVPLLEGINTGSIEMHEPILKGEWKGVSYAVKSRTSTLLTHACTEE